MWDVRPTLCITYLEPTFQRLIRTQVDRSISCVWDVVALFARIGLTMFEPLPANSCWLVCSILCFALFTKTKQDAFDKKLLRISKTCCWTSHPDHWRLLGILGDALGTKSWTLNLISDLWVTSIISLLPRYAWFLVVIVNLRAAIRNFSDLTQAEELLSKQRFLAGSCLTEADIRMFTTLVRFDMVYHGHFKVSCLM